MKVLLGEEKIVISWSPSINVQAATHENRFACFALEIFILLIELSRLPPF